LPIESCRTHTWFIEVLRFTVPNGSVLRHSHWSSEGFSAGPATHHTRKQHGLRWSGLMSTGPLGARPLSQRQVLQNVPMAAIRLPIQNVGGSKFTSKFRDREASLWNWWAGGDRATIEWLSRASVRRPTVTEPRDLRFDLQGKYWEATRKLRVNGRGRIPPYKSIRMWDRCAASLALRIPAQNPKRLLSPPGVCPGSPRLPPPSKCECHSRWEQEFPAASLYYS